MNDTKKLTGPTKDRFFERFFTEEGGLDEATAKRLAERLGEVFTSVQVRKSAAGLIGDGDPATTRRSKKQPVPTVKEAPPAVPAEQPSSEVQASSAESPSPAPVPQPEAPPAAKAATELMPTAPAETATQPSSGASAADPYAFGLVPVFKREGAKGLSEKLATIGCADHLRAMAKAQQIVLPRELRFGLADAATLRTAILEAVEKRVADRRAV